MLSWNFIDLGLLLILPVSYHIVLCPDLFDHKSHTGCLLDFLAHPKILI